MRPIGPIYKLCTPHWDGSAPTCSFVMRSNQLMFSIFLQIHISYSLLVFWRHHFWESTTTSPLHTQPQSKPKLLPFISSVLSIEFLWVVLLFCWTLLLPLQFASKFLSNIAHLRLRPKSIHQFPRSNSVTSWRLPVTSPQQLAKSWCGQKSVVSVVSCRSQIPLQQLVASKSATSWQLPRRRGSYRETCVMDFGHYCTSQVSEFRDLFVCFCFVLGLSVCKF